MLSCRNYNEKWNDELRRCGCRRCEEEYYNMRHWYERNYRNAYNYQSTLDMPAIAAPMLSVAIPKEPKMEEPKNIAIKILVEKLKAEQSSLAANEGQLKIYEGYAKTYRENKGKNQKAIKELAAALKKLGHKDA